jgi:hypothetical protein
MKKDELPRDMGLRHEEGDTDPWDAHGLRGAVVLESDIGLKKGGTYMVLRLKSGAVISLQLGTTISGNLVRDDHDAEAPVKGCKCYTCKYAPKKQAQKAD